MQVIFDEFEELEDGREIGDDARKWFSSKFPK